MRRFIRWWFTESFVYFPHGMLIFLVWLFLQSRLPASVFAIGMGVMVLITVVGSNFTEEKR